MASAGFEVKGMITEVIRGGKFKVAVNLNNGSTTDVICTPAGKLRMNNIRLIPGDKVDVEVCPDDVTKGRITWRDK